MSLAPKEIFKYIWKFLWDCVKLETRSSPANVSIRRRLLSSHKPLDLMLWQWFPSTHSSLWHRQQREGSQSMDTARSSLHTTCHFVRSSVPQYATLVSAAPPAGNLCFVSVAFISNYDFSSNLMPSSLVPSRACQWFCQLLFCLAVFTGHTAAEQCGGGSYGKVPRDLQEGDGISGCWKLCG